MKEVTEYLAGSVIDDEMLAKIDAYYQLYGAQ
jgi:hypothetical protein